MHLSNIEMVDNVMDYITEEEERLLKENYHSKYSSNENLFSEELTNNCFAEKFILDKFNISSIKEFIGMLDDLPLTNDQIKELTSFKTLLQTEININPRVDWLILYIAIKTFIASKRMEILHNINDEGLSKCIVVYGYWRIYDAILNIKWRYEDKIFNYDCPILDTFYKIKYKNAYVAAAKSGLFVDQIKEDFGYNKRWMHTSHSMQFPDEFSMEVITPSTYKNLNNVARDLYGDNINIKFF